MSLADLIEKYLMEQLQQSQRGWVEIRRNQLAEQFSCAPSQISYVLSSRFTAERGFVIETRRGGGGFVRIEKVAMGSHNKLIQQLRQVIGGSISEARALNVVARLKEDGMITDREFMVMKAAVNRRSIPIRLPGRDVVRARLLHAMIAAVCSCREDDSNDV